MDYIDSEGNHNDLDLEDIQLELEQRQIQRNISLVRNLKKSPFASLYLEEGKECMICLNSFSEQEEVIQLNCHHNHLFHYTCLLQWLNMNKKECPICRTNIQ